MIVDQYHWICSYDICHPKRLNKIHKLLCMLGIAINYSVFYLDLTQKQFQQLVTQLKKIIHPDDDIRLYRCASLHSAKVIGVLSPVGIHLMSAEGLLL